MCILGVFIENGCEQAQSSRSEFLPLLQKTFRPTYDLLLSLSLLCIFSICVGWFGSVQACITVTWHATSWGRRWLIHHGWSFPVIRAHTCACQHGQPGGEHMCYWSSLPVAGRALETDTPGGKVILITWRLWVNLEGSFGLLFPFSCAVDQTPPLVATNWVCTQAHWTFQSLTCLVPLHLFFFFTSRILMMFRWQGGLRCYSLLIIKQSFIRQL